MISCVIPYWVTISSCAGEYTRVLVGGRGCWWMGEGVGGQLDGREWWWVGESGGRWSRVVVGM